MMDISFYSRCSDGVGARLLLSIANLMRKVICVSTWSSVGLVTVVEVPSQVDQMFLHSDEGRVFLHSGVVMV